MEKVLGIGGFFFRARDPEALGKWYADHLGVAPPPASYDERSWEQQQGATVFAPFAAGSDYLGQPEQQWMLNFRVRDLGAMVSQLEAAGVEVEVDSEHYPNGHFARLADPEGNPIQLWQAEGADRDEPLNIQSP
jgi:glyoxylase I family protein